MEPKWPSHGRMLALWRFTNMADVSDMIRFSCYPLGAQWFPILRLAVGLTRPQYIKQWLQVALRYQVFVGQSYGKVLNIAATDYMSIQPCGHRTLIS